MQLYRSESSDPKTNAQRNLSDRTHYVDSDTLKYFHSRISATRILGDGLLFCITESVALDSQNKRRGFRCVVFDITGNTVFRPDLGDCCSAGWRAEKDMWAFINEFDAVKHTKAALLARKKSQAAEHKRDIAELKLIKYKPCGPTKKA